MPKIFTPTRHAILPLLAALLAILSGCGPNISPAELVGTWKITPDSQHLFPENFDVSSSTLTLKSDHTFVAGGLPQEIVLFNAPDSAVRINGSGRWELLDRQGFSNSKGFMLQFASVQGPGTYKLPYTNMIFSVDKTAGSARIFYFHDDPDLGRRIVFEKLSSAH